MDWTIPILNQVNRTGDILMYGDQARRRDEMLAEQRKNNAFIKAIQQRKIDEEDQVKNIFSNLGEIDTADPQRLFQIGRSIAGVNPQLGMSLITKAAELEAKKKEMGWDLKETDQGFTYFPKTPGASAPVGTGVKGKPPTSILMTPYQQESLNIRKDDTQERQRLAQENIDIKKENQEERVRQNEEKKLEKYTQDSSSKQSLNDSLDNLANSARDLLNAPGLSRISGILGKVLDIPGSDASVARAKLETLKNQVGMNALQAMRDASKTGGALGQVSDFENRMLQNSLTPLQNEKLDEKELRKSLQGVIDYTEKAKGRVANAFRSHWGTYKPKDMGQGGGYKTPEDVKAAFQSGKISKEKAAEILIKNFGMEN